MITVQTVLKQEKTSSPIVVITLILLTLLLMTISTCMVLAPWHCVCKATPS